jgi:hypothetical protein
MIENKKSNLFFFGAWRRRLAGRLRLASLAREVFYVSSLALAIFIVMEIMFPRIILAYFNLNYLFLLVIASGGLSLTADGR